VPSLTPIHLHVISGDLASPTLKTRKHYNSFAGAFFLPLSRVCDIVRDLPQGIDVDAAVALRALEKDAKERPPLACHRCKLGPADLVFPPVKAEGREWDAWREHLAHCVGVMEARR
jgi:aprataxin